MSTGAQLADLTLRLGHDDADGVVAELAEVPGSPAEVGDALRRHHLVGLVLQAIDDAASGPTLPTDLVSAIRANSPRAGVPADVMLDAFDELAAALSERGIPALQLKGLIFAERLYGGLERRPQYDIDVLVPRRRLNAAAATLGRLGYRRDSYDLHSRTLIRGTVKVDLHRTLRWAPAYRIDERAVWAGARWASVAGRRVPTLSDDHNLLLLVLSLYEDAGQGMAKLKQLLDLLLLVADVDPTFDWVAFFDRRAAERVLAPTVNVLALVLEVFDAAGEAPRLAEALACHRRIVRRPDREEALELVLAERKDAANLAWFRELYPGSFSLYLACFWAGGFPANLRDPRRPPVRRVLSVAAGRLSGAR